MQKKLLKRFISIFISALLLMFMSFSALAASSGSIIMKNGDGVIKDSSTYEAYNIVQWNMSQVVNGEVIYTDMVLNPAYRNTIINTLGIPLTVDSTDTEILNALAVVNDATKLAALAVALSEVTGPTPYNAVAGKFIGLPYGYYLVIETANNANDGSVLSKPILVSVPDQKSGSAEVSVSVKTSKATVEKVIVLGEGATASTTKTTEKKIGDIVNFKLTATIPTYTANATGITYYVADTLSKGLTLNIDSLVVKDDKGALIPALEHYTVSQTTAGNDNILKVDFIYASIKDLKELTITYNATLNEKASIGSVGNPNSVSLTYSNNPGTGGNFYTTPAKHTLVFTTGIQLTKVDNNHTTLSGAIFGIYSDAQCTKAVNFYTYKMITDETGTHVSTILEPGTAGTIETKNDGIACFTGLIAGEYYIKELKAPAGYDLLKQPIHVEIQVILPASAELGTETAAWTITGDNFINNNGIFHSDIINTKGFQLPGTGGIGTTIFTFGGLFLLVLAGGMSLLYLKRNRA